MRALLRFAAVTAFVLLSAAGAQEPTRMFLPAHDVSNLGKSKLAVDARGGIHIASTSITSEGFYYSYCEPGCTGPEQVSEVFFATTGVAPFLALDLDPQGRPHIVVNGHGVLAYAHCDGDCRTGSGWKYGVLHSYEPYGEEDMAVTGDALAIGPDGRAHFLVHSARKFLWQEHNTWYYTCAGQCHLAEHWVSSLIEPEQNYTYTDLHVRSDGALVAGTVAEVNYDLGMEYSIAAYMECVTNCLDGDNWVGAGLQEAYDAFWTDEVAPAISLELTAAGNPRLSFLSRDSEGEPMLVWMHCDVNCTDGNAWQGTILIDSSDYRLGAGVHMLLDAADNPRITYTVLGTILNGVCTANCTGDGTWELEIIESGSDMEPDDIFLYTNCVIGAWFLRDGQTGLLPDGRVVSVYTAEDYSFGGSVLESPGRPACPIGVDMSLGRLTLMAP